MTRIFLLVILFASITGYSSARDYKINSPDRKTGITVTTGSEIKWSATYDGKEIFSSSRIAMVLEGGQVLGENEKIERTSISRIQEMITPVVPYKRSQITDNCNILTIYFKSGFGIEFRAYNDGAAYRFETFFKQPCHCER